MLRRVKFCHLHTSHVVVRLIRSIDYVPIPILCTTRQKRSGTGQVHRPRSPDATGWSPEKYEHVCTVHTVHYVSITWVNMRAPEDARQSTSAVAARSRSRSSLPSISKQLWIIPISTSPPHVLPTLQGPYGASHTADHPPPRLILHRFPSTPPVCHAPHTMYIPCLQV